MQVLAELTFPDISLSKTKIILHNVGTSIFLNQLAYIIYYHIPWSASCIGSSGSSMQDIAALLLSKTSSKIKNNLYFIKFKILINGVWYNFSWVAIIGCL